MAVKRFASHTSVEVEAKRINLQAANTLKSNEKNAKILREYLKEKGEDTTFEEFSAEKLAAVLETFYLDLRRTDGELYKVNSLASVRYGINRYLRAPPFNKQFDIIKDPLFQRASDTFRSAVSELKREGKGDTQHHPTISETDLRKLYTSLHTSPETPCGLANKVQFDIRLYFFRRGAETMHLMTKSTLEVCSQDAGLKYVKKRKDELTKNHREGDRELITAIMPESPGNPLCPVASYIKYISKLHPQNERLWQRPLDSYVEDESWFCNIPIGVNTLQKFMPSLSKICELSANYSNHSIRTTGATVLSKNKFGPAQIMSVTGHKSVASLAVYQRVGDEEKMQMGRALQEKTLGEKPALVPVRQPPPVVTSSVAPVHGSLVSLAATSSFDTAEFHLRGINLSDNLCDYNQLPQPPTSSMPVFHGCNITHLNIHYHQH